MLLLPGFVYEPGEVTLGSYLGGLGIFVYSYFMLFYVADYMDNGISFRLRTVPLMIWSVMVNTVIAALSQLIGLAKRRQQQHWVKTEHSIDRCSKLRNPTLEEEKAAESSQKTDHLAEGM